MPPIGYRHREAIPKTKTRRKRNTGRRKTKNSGRKRSRSRSKDKTKGNKRQRKSVTHKPSCRHHGKHNTGTGRIRIGLDDNAQYIQQYLQLQERSRVKKGCCRRRAGGSEERHVHCPGCKSGEKSQMGLQDERSENVDDITEDNEVRSVREMYNAVEEDERELQDGEEEERNVLIGEANQDSCSEEGEGEGSPFRKRRRRALKLETCGNAGKLQCSRQGPLICGTVLLIPSILMTLLAFTLYDHPLVPLNIIGPVLVSLCFLMIVVGAARQIMLTIKEQRASSKDDGATYVNIEELPTDKIPEDVLTIEVLSIEDKERDSFTDNIVIPHVEVEVVPTDDDSDSSTEDDTTQRSLIVEALTSSQSTESTVSAEDICFIDETEGSDSSSSSDADYADR